MKVIAGRWRLNQTVSQPGPYSAVEIDFEEQDFAFGVERVAPAVPAMGLPTWYRVRRSGIYLVTAALTVVETVSGGNNVADVTMTIMGDDGSPVGDEWPRVESWPLFLPATPSSHTFATLVRLPADYGVSFKFSTDGESELTGVGYWEGMDRSWVEVARVADLQVVR